MKLLTKRDACTLTRLDTVEKARRLVLCVMNENPLTTDELESFEHVLSILNSPIHMRSNKELTEDEILSSII